jgi:hypothetical protein
MAEFDYGTADGVRFKIGDKVVKKNVAGISDIYEVIEFSRKDGDELENASDDTLKKYWVTVKRVRDNTVMPAFYIEDLKLNKRGGGKRRTRHRKHRKAKKTRKHRH